MAKSRFCVLLVVTFSSLCLFGQGSEQNVRCHVVPPHEVTPAEKAYLDWKLADAESLYRADLGKKPHDPELVAALVRTLLREQKVEDASKLVTDELSATHNSVAVLVASAEVQFREGNIAESAGTADQAFHADPCNPRLYLLRARIFRLNSMYASERKAIQTAHVLDPNDLDIRTTWLGTIPLAQRISEQKQFLATPNGLDPDERARLEKGLGNLEYFASKEAKTCHVVSNTNSTELPLAPLLAGGNGRHIASWGLHVSFNNTETILGVDTGASGLLINRAVAERAGLKPANRIQIGGIGDQGAQGGFTAAVDSIRVGSLEFRDCTVQVTDRKDILNMDGIIGTDVFSSYLITLDYPMRKFLLAPLPPRPSENGVSVSALQTQVGDQINATPFGASSAGSEPQDRYVAPSMKDYFPVFRSGHDLIVPVVLNGKTSRLFVLDTGAFSTVIAPDVARTLTKVHGAGSGLVRGLSGDVNKVSFSEAVNFRFAGIEQQNNDIYSFDMSPTSKSHGIEISGFLGSTLLRQLTLSIDYRDGLVKFDYDPHHGNHNF